MGNYIETRSLGSPVSFKKKKLGHRLAHREAHVKMQGDNFILKPKRNVQNRSSLTENPTC